MGAQPLLKVENLVKHFHVKLGAFGERSATVYALDNVNLEIMLSSAPCILWAAWVR